MDEFDFDEAERSWELDLKQCSCSACATFPSDDHAESVVSDTHIPDSFGCIQLLPPFKKLKCSSSGETPELPSDVEDVLKNKYGFQEPSDMDLSDCIIWRSTLSHEHFRLKEFPISSQVS